MPNDYDRWAEQEWADKGPMAASRSPKWYDLPRLLIKQFRASFRPTPNMWDNAWSAGANPRAVHQPLPPSSIVQLQPLARGSSEVSVVVPPMEKR